MNKSLQILLGLLLILVLAYVAFLDVSSKIKDDLLSKTQTVFSKNNVKKVTVNIQGEDLEMSRSLVLTGTAISERERVRIVKLTENIEGVCRIDNKITLYPVVPKAPKVPTAIKVPLVKISTETVASKSTPKEIVVIKHVEKKRIVEEAVVEKKEPIVSASSTSSVKVVPLVPVVTNTAVVQSVSPTEITIKVPSIPVPVKVISIPKVIEVEKIKLEGVK